MNWQLAITGAKAHELLRRKEQIGFDVENEECAKCAYKTGSELHALKLCGFSGVCMREIFLKINMERFI